MARMKGMGVGYIHSYGQGRGNDPESIARDVAFLDLARKHGLKVMFNLNGGGWVDRDDGVAEMLKLVDAVKDHPAFGFWYFYDEPDGRHTPEELLPFYRALKKATPDVPVAVATAWSENWKAYNDELDVLMIDIYPVQHRPFPESDIGLMTRFTDQAVALGKPVIPINQCFNWKALARGKETYRGSPVNELRYPTAAEIRYWCYSGLAQGVRGMFWWSYYHAVEGDPEWIHREFQPVSAEFREFTERVRPAHEAEIFERCRDMNVLMALWRRPGGTYLVLVNSWPLGRPVSRSTEGRIRNAVLTPWGTTRDTGATLRNGTLIVGDVEPWEVFVWELTEIEPAPAPEK